VITDTPRINPVKRLPLFDVVLKLMNASGSNELKFTPSMM